MYPNRNHVTTHPGYQQATLADKELNTIKHLDDLTFHSLSRVCTVWKLLNVLLLCAYSSSNHYRKICFLSNFSNKTKFNIVVLWVLIQESHIFVDALHRPGIFLPFLTWSQGMITLGKITALPVKLGEMKIEHAIHIVFVFLCLIWFFTSQSTISQLRQDGSSWVEPALS